MGFVNFDIRVRSEDVNKNNDLTLRGLFKYLLNAASTHSDMVGYGLDDIEITHVAWIIMNWKVEVYRYPKVAEAIHIRTWTRDISKLYTFRDFEVIDNTGTRIAIGTSKWIMVHSKTREILKIPQEVVEAFGPVNTMIFPDEIVKLQEPKEEFLNQFNYTVLRRDLDANNHVNNLNFLDFALETLPADVYENIKFKNINIMYKRQLFLGDKINCFYSKTENGKHVVVIKSADMKKLHAIIELS